MGRGPRSLDDGALALVAGWWTDKGLSASEIALKLYEELKIHKTRNAVIGIIYRMGLSGPQTPSWPRVAPRSPPPAREKPAAPRRITAAPAAAAPKRADSRGEVVIVARALALAAPAQFDAESATAAARATLDLGAGDCKYPVGAGTGMQQLHCGRPQAPDDGVYCAEHRALCGGARIEPSKAEFNRRLGYAWR